MKQPSNNFPQLNWKQAIAPYLQAHKARSLWQLLSTLALYAAALFLMYKSLSVSYWVTLILAVPTAGLLVRIFIIFHDCTHGAFFKSAKANDGIGYLTGVITFTPYRYWQHEHAIHHASAGDLDNRGIGDIWTMTVKEYKESSRLKRLQYRLVRNPFILFGVAPTFWFLIKHRIAPPRSTPKERQSITLTNLGLLGILILMYFTVGLKAYFLIQLPILVLSAGAGLWLFYVQHQFEGVYWEHSEKWDYVTEALQGSSFYKLPKILQWFTGNIGFHHVHHLSPKIPNYYLEKCHLNTPFLRNIKPITLMMSLKSLSFRLWDEENHRLIRFDELKFV